MSSGWIGQPPVACGTCGQKPEEAVRCDACWELESRLASYLTRGGSKAMIFVQKKLGEAATAHDAKPTDVREPSGPPCEHGVRPPSLCRDCYEAA